MSQHQEAPYLTLRRAVDEEAVAVAALVDLLREEQSLLSQGQTEDLPALAEQKSGLFVRLNAATAQRNEVIAAAGFSSDRHGMAAWCSAHAKTTDLLSRWENVLSLAAQARELNRVNGEIIQLQIQFTNKALDALRAGSNALNLYGPDGQSSAAGGKRIHDFA